MVQITILQGDITQLAVDAIVNAANTRLLGGGGVDGAIHRAAGPELLAACRKIGGCSTGQAVITPGFNLPAAWVIHTVGPVWQGGGAGEPDQLQACYQNSFQIAREKSVKRIAFPCISTGVYGYPKEAAARIALRAMLDEEVIDEIIACCFSQSDVEIYQVLLRELGAYRV